MVITVGNELGNPSSKPGRGCLYFSANTLGRGINLTILPSVMSK